MQLFLLLLLHLNLPFTSSHQHDHVSTIRRGWQPIRDYCSYNPPDLSKYGLEISVLKRTTLFNSSNSFADAGHAYTFADGEINVLVRYGANQSRAVRSTDSGATFHPLPQQRAPYENRSVSEVRTYSVQRRRNKEVFLFSGFSSHSRKGFKNGQDFRRQLDGSILAELLRSTNGGLSTKSSLARIWLPQNLLLQNLQHAPMVELKNGSLVCATYAHWTGVDGFFTIVYDENTLVYPKDRTFIIRSDDDGKNWYYRSTVAFDPSNETSNCVLNSDGQGTPPCSIVEGFNEPWLQIIPSDSEYGKDRIIAFMRTCGSEAVGVEELDGIISGPLYRSISVDGGETWGIVQAVADRGVAPTTVYLKAPGVMVVAYGRPSNFLMFSTDQGRSFFGHWCFLNGAIGSRYDGSQYNSITAVEEYLKIPAVMTTYTTCTSQRNCTSEAMFLKVQRVDVGGGGVEV